jgi:hypothetical protein
LIFGTESEGNSTNYGHLISYGKWGLSDTNKKKIVIIGPWPVPSTKCSGLDDDDDDCDYDIESVNEFTEDTISDMLINVPVILNIYN